MPAYFVQDEEGLIRTITADSPIGAIKAYMRKYKPRAGTGLSVKERGRGDWEIYDIR